tara:strand:- start:913 stop:1077 length:165 start_codon:yes stop_codon:yes gene_type:complete
LIVASKSKIFILSLVSNEQSKTGGGTKNRGIYDFDLYLLNIDIINEYVVARGGI